MPVPSRCRTTHSLGRAVFLLALTMLLFVLCSCSSRRTASQPKYQAVRSFDNGQQGSAGPRPQLAVANSRGGVPSVNLLWDRCHHLSKQKLGYSFGSDSPYNGGMDCSGTVQFVLKSLGYSDAPRASYQQYQWMSDMGCIRKVGFWHSEEKAYASLKPGDLVFWGGTYDSGHKVSHVEIYMGKNPKTGQQFTFGARSSRSRGLNGNGVDVFEMSRRKRGQLVGYGTLPGLRR